MTKKQAVLGWLQSGRTLSKKQAWEEISTLNLSGIINVLRGEGHNILTEMRINLNTGSYFAEYFLIAKIKEQA